RRRLRGTRCRRGTRTGAGRAGTSTLRETPRACPASPSSVRRTTRWARAIASTPPPGTRSQPRRRPYRAASETRAGSSCLRSYPLLRRVVALADRELLHRHGLGGTSHRAEAAPDAPVVVLHHRRQRKPACLRARDQIRADRVVEVERLERHDGEAVLGTHVDAPVAQHALFGVVDRLDVADEAARSLAARVGGIEAGLDFGNTGPASEVDGRGRLAIEQLEAGEHPVLRGRNRVDLDRGAYARAIFRQQFVDRTRRTLPVRHRLDEIA